VAGSLECGDDPQLVVQADPLAHLLTHTPAGADHGDASASIRHQTQPHLLQSDSQPLAICVTDARQRQTDFVGDPTHQVQRGLHGDRIGFAEEQIEEW